jgi:hypothetical protein
VPQPRQADIRGGVRRDAQLAVMTLVARLADWYGGLPRAPLELLGPALQRGVDFGGR